MTPINVVGNNMTARPPQDMSPKDCEAIRATMVSVTLPSGEVCPAVETVWLLTQDEISKMMASMKAGDQVGVRVRCLGMQIPAMILDACAIACEKPMTAKEWHAIHRRCPVEGCGAEMKYMTLAGIMPLPGQHYNDTTNDAWCINNHKSKLHTWLP